MFYSITWNITLKLPNNSTVQTQFKEWLEKPTKDLQIANMYRRLQKVVTHIIFSFLKKKKSFIISFNILFYFLALL